jgi:hypothetical protein
VASIVYSDVERLLVDTFTLLEAVHPLLPGTAPYHKINGVYGPNQQFNDVLDFITSSLITNTNISL